jgi:purine-binding chemotaxis protein CheW
VTEGPDSGLTYVLFRLGTEQYALPVSAVVSVVRYQQPTPVPRSSAEVLGVINLRGRVLPVVDLGRRFGSSEFEAQSLSRVVVAESALGSVGVAVDAASEVVTFAEDEIKAVPESVLGPETAKAFRGMVERESGIVVLLDPDEAMPKRELDVMRSAVSSGKEAGGDD